MNAESSKSSCPACGKENSFFNVVCAHCQQPLTSSPEVLADLQKTSTNTPLGPWQRFELKDILGRGGMGTVYRAFDPRLNRTVAIKILHAEVADHSREQLLEEARKACALTHPNLATIHELVIDADPPFLVMELIEGVPLSERLVAGPLNIKKALSIARKIAEALAAIHESGLAHLDLKPANIMLTPDNNIRLLDFGLARAFRNRLASREVSVSGTWGYLSPEQSLGDAGGPSADIFALGVVLYEMLAGTLPFSRESPEASLEALRQGEFAPLPAQIAQHTALNRIVKKCLNPHRADRYTDMNSVTEALQRVEQNLTDKTHRVPRTSTGLAVWVAVFFLAIAATFMTVRFWPLTEQASPTATTEKAAKRLLMVPFHNLAGTPKGQVLTDGMQQTLTQALLEHYDTGEWWILPASEVRQHQTLIPSQARDLYEADFLIEGHLSEQGPVLHFSLSLVDTRQNRVVTAQSVETTDGSLANLQIQAMQALADMLQLSPRDENNLATLTWETPRRQAHAAYIRGTGLLYRYDAPQNLEAAMTAFQESITHDPSYAPPQDGIAQAQIHLWRKSHQPPDLEKAHQFSLKATQLNPAWASAWHTRGTVALLQGQTEIAQQHFEKAIRLDPQAANTLSELGKLYQRKNRTQEAEIYHQKALALQPHSWILHNRLGIFYTGNAKYSEAEKAFRQVVRLMPDNLLVYQNLAAVLHLQGRPEEALKAIQAALVHGQTPNLYSNLGTILFYIGRYAEACDAFAEAVARNENQYLFWGNLADAQRWTSGREKEALQSYGKAISLLEAFLEQRPEDAQAIASLALFLAKSGNIPLATTHLESILPSSDGFLCYTAVTVFELAGKRETALTYLQCALKAGYSFQEIDHDPELSNLRKDAAFLKLRSP